MIKPDGFARNLQDEIVKRVESAGIKILKKYEHHVSKEQAEDLYSVHQGKHFYAGLVRFITSGPVVCCMAEGENAILALRDIMGVTDPREAAAGSIRGDLKEENVLNSEGIIKNMVHGSDSPESAQRELAIFFK